MYAIQSPYSAFSLKLWLTKSLVSALWPVDKRVCLKGLTHAPFLFRCDVITLVEEHSSGKISYFLIHNVMRQTC